MRGFSFIRQVKLPDVCGKINYISSHEEQEHLYATYETNPEPFWEDLARECQSEFRRSGAKGKCIEARELIIALPKSLQRFEAGAMLKAFTDAFKERYGVECSSALHHNPSKRNYHIHLIYSERKLLDNPEKKTATRNMFFDKSGKRVRTKKEICDSNGAIKPGCFIVRKGEVYEQHMFTAKDDFFKSRAFVKEVKHLYTEMINTISRPDEKLKVFDPNSPFLATKKIGKNNPLEKDIREDNAVRDDWNRQVSRALNLGITEEALNEMKQSEIIEPINDSIMEHGKSHLAFRQIVLRASATARNYIKRFQLSYPEDRIKMMTTALKEFIERCRAPEQFREVKENRSHGRDAR